MSNANKHTQKMFVELFSTHLFRKKKFVRDETKERKFLRHPHFETKSKKRHLKFFQHFIMKSRIKTKDIKRREWKKSQFLLLSSDEIFVLKHSYKIRMSLKIALISRQQIDLCSLSFSITLQPLDTFKYFMTVNFFFIQ